MLMITNRFGAGIAFAVLAVFPGISLTTGPSGTLTPDPSRGLTPSLSPTSGRGVRLPDSTVVDTFRIYYVGYAIGTERSTTIRDTSGYRISGEYESVDRGRTNHSTSRLRYERDFTPQLIEVTTITDTSRRVTTRIDVRDHQATIVTRGETTTVALPPVAFAISGANPTTQRMALVRYWLAHGRPATLPVAPGNPNDVRIEDRGR